MTKTPLWTLIFAAFVVWGGLELVSYIKTHHQVECDNLQLWGDVTQLKLRGC